MRKYALILFVLPVLLLACADPESKKQIEVLNEGIGRSSSYFTHANNLLYQKLEAMRIDESTKEKTDRWWPAIKEIHLARITMMATLDSLNVVIPHSKLLATTRQTRSLFDKLLACKKRMAGALDASVAWFPEAIQDSLQNYIVAMREQFPLMKGLSIDVTDTEKEEYFSDWTSSHFNKSSPQFYQSILGKLRNDVLFTENGLLEYCNKHTNVYSTGGFSPYK